MFSYYGSKSKLVKYYPHPKFDTIIEPFAGSAQYSFYYWDKNIILIEKDNRIAAVWDYLINDATKESVLKLPLFYKGQKIEHDNPAVRDLIALESNRGCGGSPRPTVQNRNRWAYGGRERIANNLYKIKHWKIIRADYQNSPDIKATWFIDPPYNNSAGKEYRVKFFDYKLLADWCKNRLGQAIVCENQNADWLPFRSLVDFHGMKKTQTEVVWLSEGNYNIQQIFEF